MKPKVLVIGLDCATFRFIHPFAAQGYLPNLARVMTEGVSRVMKSTIPPISPPAWTTFLTGKNPGRHGIFQFVNMDVSDYAFTRNRLINSTLFSGSTFIDTISDSGLNVGIVKIPFTYPPWEVNGFMIAGEPSPDWTKAHTYPPGLSEKLGRMNMGNSTDFMLYNTEKLFEHLKFDCEVRTRITCEMLNTHASDFFMVVHTVTDAAAHRFWKFTDPKCPNYKKRFTKYENIIRDVYALVDRSIGQILQKIDDQTTVFIMSDHGAARNSLYYFHINAWLREQGYLRCEEKAGSRRLLHSLLVKIKNALPPRLKHLAVSTIKRKYFKNVSGFQIALNSFRWPDTRAYAVPIYPTVAGIVLNLKGRQPEGVVEPGKDADRMVDEIRAKLEMLRDPRTGSDVVKEVLRREDIYAGEHAKKMPDLIVKYNPEYRGGKGVEPPYFSNVPAANFEFQSGDHHEDGIFIAYGPEIQKGIELGASDIQDMAPTILYTIRLPIPEDIDGQVMLDIFNSAFVTANPVRTTPGKKERFDDSYELTDDEEDEMKKQLKGLGYL
jgi:predicted AlkP superfamily phosphohydrolase/phosphomutase